MNPAFLPQLHPTLALTADPIALFSWSLDPGSWHLALGPWFLVVAPLALVPLVFGPWTFTSPPRPWLFAPRHWSIAFGITYLATGSWTLTRQPLARGLWPLIPEPWLLVPVTWPLPPWSLFPCLQATGLCPLALAPHLPPQIAPRGPFHCVL